MKKKLHIIAFMLIAMAILGCGCSKLDSLLDSADRKKDNVVEDIGEDVGNTAVTSVEGGLDSAQTSKPWWADDATDNMVAHNSAAAILAGGQYCRVGKKLIYVSEDGLDVMSLDGEGNTELIYHENSGEIKYLNFNDDCLFYMVIPEREEGEAGEAGSEADEVNSQYMEKFSGYGIEPRFGCEIRALGLNISPMSVYTTAKNVADYGTGFYVCGNRIFFNETTGYGTDKRKDSFVVGALTKKGTTDSVTRSAGARLIARSADSIFLTDADQNAYGSIYVADTTYARYGLGGMDYLGFDFPVSSDGQWGFSADANDFYYVDYVNYETPQIMVLHIADGLTDTLIDLGKYGYDYASGLYAVDGVLYCVLGCEEEAAYDPDYDGVVQYTRPQVVAAVSGNTLNVLSKLSTSAKICFVNGGEPVLKETAGEAAKEFILNKDYTRFEEQTIGEKYGYIAIKSNVTNPDGSLRYTEINTINNTFSGYTGKKEWICDISRYNERDNLIMEQYPVYNCDLEKYEIFTAEYEYDDKDRCVRRKCYWKDGNIASDMEITYAESDDAECVTCTTCYIYDYVDGMRKLAYYDVIDYGYGETRSYLPDGALRKEEYSVKVVEFTTEQELPDAQEAYKNGFDTFTKEFFGELLDEVQTDMWGNDLSFNSKTSAACGHTDLISIDENNYVTFSFMLIKTCDENDEPVARSFGEGKVCKDGEATRFFICDGKDEWPDEYTVTDMERIDELRPKFHVYHLPEGDIWEVSYAYCFYVEDCSEDEDGCDDGPSYYIYTCRLIFDRKGTRLILKKMYCDAADYDMPYYVHDVRYGNGEYVLGEERSDYYGNSYKNFYGEYESEDGAIKMYLGGSYHDRKFRIWFNGNLFFEDTDMYNGR